MHKTIYSAFVFILLFDVSPLMAQLSTVESGVYNWDKLEVEKIGKNEKRSILKGSTIDLKFLEINAWTLAADENFKEGKPNKEVEQMLIVKDGILNLVIGKVNKELGPGSMALIIPGEKFSINNNKNEPVTFYWMSYVSHEKIDLKRGKNEGGSFMMDWNEINFKPHDRGGIRNYYNRPTAMCKYAEMHVTTLNGEIKSHEPHTHRAAEIVLMIEGNTEMEIGDGLYQGTAGDIYFLGSNVSHAIRNKEKDPCIYFAFQWE